MWIDQQLGAVPEARALAGPQGNFPGWSPAHKLSGLAADLWTLKFDEKGKIYPNGVPQRGRIVEGVFVYDPRLDSTYPGGSGPCRLGNETTYVWSECPALHALTWAFGRIQNGVLIAGGGLKIEGIDMAPFVDWANVCDANAWKAGGIVYTSSDDSWDILKMIAQAGGGEVMPVGAQLSCTYSAPRVSIGRITSEDIAGDIDAPGTSSRRLRRNTVIARVRLETHGWEEVPLDAVPIPAYVAIDGGSRPTELTFPLVQQVDQGVQLGLYAMWNGRELDNIVIPAKVYAIGYRPGDCLTIDIPEASLNSREVVVRNREIEGSTMGVTLTCRSETFAKHAFCLGKTGKAPPTPDLSVPQSFAVDNHPAYELLDQDLSYPFSSADTSITITPFSAVVRDGIGSIDFPAGSVTGLASATSYTLFWTLAAHDEPLVDEAGVPITDEAGVVITVPTAAGQYVAYPTPALSQQQSSDFVYLRKISTLLDGQAPPSETPPPGDGGNGAGGGGNCVTADSLVLMADTSWKRAGDLKRGDRVRTQHEATLAWGDFTVAAVSISSEQVMRAPGHPDATPMHRFWHDGWTHMHMIGEPAGWNDVARISVAGAQTYVARHPNTAEGVLSHNLKPIRQVD